MVYLNNYIANFVSILNYASITKRSYCRIVYTKFGESLSSLLFRNGYILSYRILNMNSYSYLYIQLKKTNMFNPLKQLKLISRPNNNKYWSVRKLLNECMLAQNITCYILSTSSGIMFSNNAIDLNIGGKVLFKIN